MTEPVLSLLASPQALPPALSGCVGTNRTPVGVARQIAADDDVAAIGLWLAEYHDSSHTFRSYRKEATRLLLWATQVRGKPRSEEHTSELQSLMRTPYAVFCLK